jgi:hypothetical protein
MCWACYTPLTEGGAASGMAGPAAGGPVGGPVGGPPVQDDEGPAQCSSSGSTTAPTRRSRSSACPEPGAGAGGDLSLHDGSAALSQRCLGDHGHCAHKAESFNYGGSGSGCLRAPASGWCESMAGILHLCICRPAISADVQGSSAEAAWPASDNCELRRVKTALAEDTRGL